MEIEAWGLDDQPASLADQPAQLSWQPSHSVRDPASKIKVEIDRGRHRELTSGCHMYVHISV